MSLIRSSRTLCKKVEQLSFEPPVAYVYNPLVYAREPHEAYLNRYGSSPKRALLVGMNPGPFGMAQTGVPFGDVAMVRDFLGIAGTVEHPKHEHPKRPVTGFACTRSEVSGTRLWGWAQQRFETAEAFFRDFFVYNYCPLAFMEESGRNRTPDKLTRAERDALYAVCDKALMESVKTLSPSWVIGIGGFAEERSRSALAGRDVNIGSIIHPSPANPQANRGWSAQVDRQLAKYGF